MKTKEAIEFINDLEIYIHGDYPEFREYKEAFITLLKRGEAYEEMWEEGLKNRAYNSSSSSWETLTNAINDLQRKYLKDAK